MCADDTQLYVPIYANNGDVQCAIDTLENCVCEVRKWMHINVLKLYDKKTRVNHFQYKAGAVVQR